MNMNNKLDYESSSIDNCIIAFVFLSAFFLENQGEGLNCGTRLGPPNPRPKKLRISSASHVVVFSPNDSSGSRNTDPQTE